MKFVTYLLDGAERVGALSQDEAAVYPLPCRDMLELIEHGPRMEVAGEAIPLSNLKLLAPIPRPRQDVICLGINYKAHADEAEQYSTEFKKERPIPI